MITALVNLSTPNYTRGQDRLEKSLKIVGYKGLVETYTDESQLSGCPKHKDCPYAFKTYAIGESKGELILWLDASIWAVKSLEPIFQMIERDGYAFCAHGEITGLWTNDRTLERYRVTRDEAMEIPMLSAFVLGFNMANLRTRALFRDWMAGMDYFKGSWHNHDNSESADPRCRGHRHDQSVLSILAWKYGMKAQIGHDLCPYIRDGQTTPETAILHAQGI